MHTVTAFSTSKTSAGGRCIAVPSHFKSLVPVINDQRLCLKSHSVAGYSYGCKRVHMYSELPEALKAFVWMAYE